MERQAERVEEEVTYFFSGSGALAQSDDKRGPFQGAEVQLRPLGFGIRKTSTAVRRRKRDETELSDCSSAFHVLMRLSCTSAAHECRRTKKKKERGLAELG